MQNDAHMKRVTAGKVTMAISFFSFFLFILLSRSSPDHGFLTNLLNYMYIAPLDLDYPIFHDTFLCSTNYYSFGNSTNSYNNCTLYLKTKYFVIFSLVLFFYGLMMFLNLSLSPKEIFRIIFPKSGG